MTQKEKDDKIAEINGKIRSTRLAQYGAATLGNIAGIVYAKKTGGGFWRYLGFMFLGGIVVGGGAYMVSSQVVNKYVTELEKLNNEKVK